MVILGQGIHYAVILGLLRGPLAPGFVTEILETDDFVAVMER